MHRSMPIFGVVRLRGRDRAVRFHPMLPLMAFAQHSLTLRSISCEMGLDRAGIA